MKFLVCKTDSATIRISHEQFLAQMELIKLRKKRKWHERKTVPLHERISSAEKPSL